MKRGGTTPGKTNIDFSEPTGAFVGATSVQDLPGTPPRKARGPQKAKSSGFMAEGDSAATSLKAASKPTYWRRGGFVSGRLASGGKLSMGERKALPSSDFALPGKGKGPSGKGSGSYPIPDASHARNALARSSGKPVAAAVRAKVHAKFPNIGKK